MTASQLKSPRLARPPGPRDAGYLLSGRAETEVALADSRARELRRPAPRAPAAARTGARPRGGAWRHGGCGHVRSAPAAGVAARQGPAAPHDARPEAGGVRARRPRGGRDRPVHSRAVA